VAITIEWETDEQWMERCDHEGTTDPLGRQTTVSVCSECGKAWPTRLGAGVPTVRLVSKSG
jgi:hypothetical protein